MKRIFLFIALCGIRMLPAQDAPPAEPAPAAPTPAEKPAVTADNRESHKEASSKVATLQDELAADVQQLALEQTVEKVIALLKECEDLMGEATEKLLEEDTGGGTIAAQTEIIEKIMEAAKERQKQSGGSDAGGGMMEMMKQMAGDAKEGTQPGQQPGQAESDANQGGKGKTGLSDAANGKTDAAGTGATEQRKVPKAAGSSGKALPEEFRGALDAYNRGAEKLTK